MNLNDLASIQCPGCKSSGPFKIAATTLFTMNIHGADTFDDPEFDRGSYCQCPKCGRGGIVEDFRQRGQTEPPARTCPFTTADTDRLLGLADQFLENWAEDAIQSGEPDEDYEQNQEEWQALRPILVAAPDVVGALNGLLRAIWAAALPCDVFADAGIAAAYSIGQAALNEALPNQPIFEPDANDQTQ
jgi:hypothetical protein